MGAGAEHGNGTSTKERYHFLTTFWPFDHFRPIIDFWPLFVVLTTFWPLSTILPLFVILTTSDHLVTIFDILINFLTTFWLFDHFHLFQLLQSEMEVRRREINELVKYIQPFGDELPRVNERVQKVARKHGGGGNNVCETREEREEETREKLGMWWLKWMRPRRLNGYTTILMATQVCETD